jgi:V/A-type H+-transporting ATPase subunit E
MAEDIQGLLNRIQSDGIEKAEAEKKRILDNAKQQADELVAKAREEAEAIMKSAREEAVISENKGKAAVKQAARDVILSLQTELQNRLEGLVRDSLGQAITPEVMGQIVVKMAEKYLAQDNGSTVEILLSPADAAALEAGLKAGLLVNLKAKPEIQLSSNIASGLKIGVKGTDLFFDFSDDALTDVICSYAGPKLAAAIKG